MKKHGAAGFTLIELMTVVVVIAILGAVAYPSYMDHVAKAKRAEGKVALLKAAQMLERMYSDRSTYGNTPAPPATPTSIDLAPLFGLAAGATVYSSENPANPDKNNVAGKGKAAYTIAAAAPTAPTGPCPLAACFLITATPNPDAPFSDPTCGNFTLTSTGTRAATGPGAATTACKW